MTDFSIKWSYILVEDIALKMITINDATELVKENIPSRSSIIVDSEKSLGLHVSEDIFSPEQAPRYTNSAMDGYAFNWSSLDLSDPNKLYKLVGESQAGNHFDGVINDGEIIRINTGAALPSSADTVIRLEDTEEVDGYVKIVQPPKKQGTDVRYSGEEFEKGELLLTQGTCILAPQVALLAAVGINKVSVYKPTEVTLIITGSELVSSASKVGDFQIRDSNMSMLVAAVEEAGAKVVKCIRVPDDQDATRLAIANATTDIVLCTGGVSVGKHDHVKSAAASGGYEEIFWRIKQKPGKPLFFAKKDSALLFGLPGNPVSAFMCFTHYIRPLIGHLNGLNFGWPMVAGEALTDIANTGKRTCMIRVKLSWHPNSGYCITDAVAQGSHMLTSISKSDGYIIVEPGDVLKKGMTADVYCYNALKEII